MHLYKVFFSIALFLGSVFMGSYIAYAADVQGWLWGGSENPSNSAPGGETGLGWIHMKGANYGVDIPEGDGNVTGYAWSEHYGWIDFDPSGPYPGAPTSSIARSGDNLVGWARIVAIQDAGGNSGGWDGWIKMYNASIEPSGDLTGYAWNGEYNLAGGLVEGIGWIDLSRASMTVSSNVFTICSSNCNSGIQTSSNFIMAQGTSKIIAACFENSSDGLCNGGSSAEVAANWNANDTPDDAISLSNTNPISEQVINANNIATEVINVSYDDGVATHLEALNVTVISGSSCGDGNLDVGEECDDGSSNNGSCPKDCSSSCLSNSCSGGGGGGLYIEVTP